TVVMLTPFLVYVIKFVYDFVNNKNAKK
ncbi:MAG: hypothetical protein RLZZ156_422, partial [Deinococcota bacterium]